VAGLKKYEVTTDSGYTTTLLLSDEDAKVRGLLKPTQAKQAPAPQNKQATPAANK
jgi:hypothetical protein